MRILVTGGAGFIGSHVVDAYVEGGHSVSVVDDLSTGFRANLNPEATFYEADIRDNMALAKVFEQEKPEVVNHHAAQMSVNVSVNEPRLDAEINVLGSLNLLELCRRRGVQKVIYSSSGGTVYGEPLSLPVKEDHPTMPVSPYGVTKLAVEHYLQAFGKMYGLDYSILRYPNVFGPRQNPLGEAGVIAIFTGSMLANRQPVIYGDGKHAKDYVHVSDVARASVLALSRGRQGAYNIGSGKTVSVQEIFDQLARLTGYRGKPKYAAAREGDVRKFCLDSGKAARELGWKPKLEFGEALKLTVEYYKRAGK